jgi:uncharacterized membrane protein
MSTDIWGQENAGLMWTIMLGIGLLLYGLWVFAQWRVFAKAGFPGALSLINLAIFVPLIGPLVVIGLQVWFAFANWPALKRA